MRDNRRGISLMLISLFDIDLILAFQPVTTETPGERFSNFVNSFLYNAANHGLLKTGSLFFFKFLIIYGLDPFSVCRFDNFRILKQFKGNQLHF